ncbi:MAG: efflux RND transporter permease subunit [Spirochaetota bacterium]|nr:efflux RND transporter permease subunit [Spirochaetota bacterium]
MKQLWIKTIDFLSENMFITNILIIMILLIGIFVNGRIRKEIAPQVEADAIHINIYYPTASAQEIEQDVIVPLEKIIQSFDVSVQYTSFANDAYGRIKALLPIDKNLANNRQRLFTALQNIPNITKDARITITEEGVQSIPIYYFSLQLKDAYTNQFNLLQQEADIINKKIKRHKDVYTVETSGLLRKEIFVNINPNKLSQYYISLQEIVKSLFRRNISSSEGLLDINNSEKIFITDAGFNYPLDITNTILRSNFEKQTVSINDIASTEEGFEVANNDVFINNSKAVFFGVRIKQNVNFIKFTKELDEMISQIKTTLPKELKLIVVEKRAESIDTVLKFTQSSALIGILIVFLVLLIFLDWRTALWTTVGIPITISLLVITLFFTNVSMNMLTLCGIITVLGMLVDHGIIISENIYRYRNMDYSPREATKLGVSEVFSPILVTVLTTIAAFLPLLLIQDTIGNIIKPLPIVICIALIFSFFEAIFFLPIHLSHIPLANVQQKQEKWFEKWKQEYGKLLKKALEMRYFIILIFLGILFATLVLISHMFKGFVFMEPIGISSLYVNLEAKAGTSRYEMKQFVSKLTEVVENTIPEHERTIIKEEIGKYHIISFSSQGFSPNRGQIAIYLSSLAERDRDATEILNSIQEAVGNSPHATNFTRVFYDSFGLIPKITSALNMRFLQGIGSSSKNYIEAMQEVFTYVNTIDGVVNPEHSSLCGKSRILLEFDYQKMAQLGIDAQIVSETLKIAISGFVPTIWRNHQEKIPYIIRLDPKYKNSIEDIQNLLIPNIFNKLIPLKLFTKTSEVQGQEDILRSSGQRMVEIYLDVDPLITTPTSINKKINKYYETIKDRYPDVDIQTSGESVTIANAFEDFKLAFLIAGILIYIILLMLFKEPLQPFIVLIAIPFGIIGSVWAFYFHNQVLSFMSLVGIVGLSGIVVNDAVVMVDFINKVINKADDTSNVISLIIMGAENRLKAVLLTTLTTVVGLLPSIYGLQGVADLIVPITTAIAYGLLFATVLTLFFIPVLYMVSYDLKKIVINNFFINKRTTH